MKYGFIKNNVCTNTAVFDDQKSVQDFIEATKDLEHYDYDDIVRLSEGSGLGSLYQGGKWIMQETLNKIPEPLMESYLIDLDYRLSLIELGLKGE